MNRHEIGLVLDYAGKIDPRIRRDMSTPETSAALVRTWSEVLAEVPMLVPAVGWDVSTAVAAYYEAGDQARFWAIQPAALLAAWAPRRRSLMERHTDPVPAVSADDEDNEQAYRRRLAADRRAVLAGQRPPNEVRALTGGPHATVAAAWNGAGRREYDTTRDQLAERAPDGMRRTRYPELSVACPVETCRALPLRPCTTPSGRQLTKSTHPSRREAHAQRAAETAGPA